MINIDNDLELLGVSWPITEEELLDVYNTLIEDNTDKDVVDSITESYVRVLSQIKVNNKYNNLKEEQNNFMSAFFGSKFGPWGRR